MLHALNGDDEGTETTRIVKVCLREWGTKKCANNVVLKYKRWMIRMTMIPSGMQKMRNACLHACLSRALFLPLVLGTKSSIIPLQSEKKEQIVIVTIIILLTYPGMYENGAKCRRETGSNNSCQILIIFNRQSFLVVIPSLCIITSICIYVMCAHCSWQLFRKKLLGGGGGGCGGGWDGAWQGINIMVYVEVQVLSYACPQRLLYNLKRETCNFLKRQHLLIVFLVPTSKHTHGQTTNLNVHIFTGKQTFT